MRKVLLALVSLAALSGCGLKGDLVRPMPMWGDPPLDGPTDPRVIKAEEDRKAAEKAKQDEADRAAEAARQARLQQQLQASPAPAPADQPPPAPAPVTTPPTPQ